MTKVVVSDIDVFLVIDTTTSSNAEDVRRRRHDPPRPDQGRTPSEVATEYGGARYSVITFDNGSLVRLPLVADPTALQTTLDTLEVELSTYAGGSSISEPLETLLKRLKGSQADHPERLRLVFYFGDGEQTRDDPPESMAEAAPFIGDGAVFGYGTEEGGPMRPNLDFGVQLDPDAPDPAPAPYLLDTTQPGDPIAISRIDEDALKTIASELGVGYQHRTPGTEPSFPDVEDRMGEEIEVPEVAVAERLYWIPVLAAFALLLWDLVLAGRNVGDLRAARPPRTPARTAHARRPPKAGALMGWWSERFEREGVPEEKTMPARRRRMLLFSMILVIPLGVFAVGTGINVALASAVRTSFAAGDYDGAAAWARAGVSLNPFDQYLPHYNLGTAYAGGDLLPEAVPELQTALDAAPSPEAACYPRANLALTYVRLGNRYFDEQAWDAAIDAYRQAKALWAKQQNDVCHQDQSFSETAEESSEEAEEGENQAQQQQEQEQQNPTPTPTPTPTPDPSQTPTRTRRRRPGPSQTPDPNAHPDAGSVADSDPTPNPTVGHRRRPVPVRHADPEPVGDADAAARRPTPGTGRPDRSRRRGQRDARREARPARAARRGVRPRARERRPQARSGRQALVTPAS